MFKFIISINPSVYAFLSALLLSVATSAATMISFADGSTKISPSVGWTGLVAFLGGVLWFVQSENVTNLRRSIDTLAQASRSWESAVDAQPKSAKIRTISIAVVGVFFTAGWPFVKAVMAVGDVPVSNGLVNALS